MKASVLAFLLASVACSATASEEKTMPAASAHRQPSWDKLAARMGKPLSSLPGMGGSGKEGWVFHARSGKPEAVLVCLHGIQTHSAWFAPLAEKLTAHNFTLICPDRRGSGLDPGNTGLTARAPEGGWRTWVTDVQASINAGRKLAPKVYLVGTSWGAKTALACLASGESLPNGSLLLVPAVKTKMEGPGVAISTILSSIVHWKTGAALPLDDEDYLPRDSGSQPASGQQDSNLLIEDMRLDGKLKRRGTLGFQRAARKMQKEALKQLEQSGFPVPVAVAFADQDRIVSQEKSEAMLVRVPGYSKPLALSSAGHGVQVMDPGLLSDRILLLMKQLRRQ